MARYAIIDNDEVINVIIADAKFIKETKMDAIECNDNVCPGWKYINKEFVQPEPVVYVELNDSQTV